MKHLIKSILLLLFLLGSSQVIPAQNNRQRLTREQLAEVQARYIAGQSGMNKAESKQFIATYLAFQEEIWALGPRMKKQHSNNMTDAETEDAIKKRFERSQKILSIREKYYSIYSKFLTQKKIQKVYFLEKQVMQRLIKHQHNNKKDK